MTAQTAQTAPELTELAADRTLLGRAGTAERVAAALRERITQGLFRPGMRLSEEHIGRALGVSRNTLREAFRLLTHERLLEHRLNRGTFVRKLDSSDIEDIYHVRHLVECTALRGLGGPPFELEALRSAVRDGQKAAACGDWATCGTADIHFHQAIAALARSRRTDDLMRGVLAELRLAFHVMDDPRRFHEPYLTRNRDILAALETGDAHEAERMLGFYLEDSRRQLTEAYPERP